MTVIDCVSITKAANGYIVYYKETSNNVTIEAEFVATELEEALDIVRDIFQQDEQRINLGHLANEQVGKDPKR